MDVPAESQPGTAAASRDSSITPLRAQIRRAVLWRSGSQIVAQIVQWTATFLVIRILAPADYGLFAMTQVVLMLASMLNGMGLANAVVRQPTVTPHALRQVFGMLIATNALLAVVQIAAAPIVAAYYRQPEITTILRVQALLYGATPLIALPQALLARTLEFRRQAQVNVAASLLAASNALGGALMGLGVWTLVAAPIVLFWVRGIGLTIAAGGLPRPSFAFRGSGEFARYGGLLAAGQFFAFIWSQADVFVGGRVLDPAILGLYTTSLFLVQIVVSKIVPPLNEVAFAAYARMQDDPDAVAAAFLKLVRVVMVIAMPFYLGLAATAEPLVATILGSKWVAAAPIAAVLALSMPFYTVQVLLGPATDALGRPGIAARNGLTAALIAPVAVLIAIPFGVIALAACWLGVFPLLLAISARRALPVIGVSARALIAAVAPPVAAASAMGLVLTVVDRMSAIEADGVRLALLVACGAAVYGTWLLIFARDSVREMLALLRRR
ncbi:Lipopolysaccharide biosynthesis protein [Sphingomonas sp. EC-HK361]|uniref:lipopolysaccharide biosynthesis protein n=1 Tax=Sphingomonas sp. EC-HK361 TaxID=2038397 RepID=UPI0012529A44|nr:lipopolysaccharide biosynthesis protein [Sphingomonas sp. EC-HK361]VVS96669.1 Lipopolysaccharide biosynthesis protein [Sphingomonas sp. EC-HK361]